MNNSNKFKHMLTIVLTASLFLTACSKPVSTTLATEMPPTETIREETIPSETIIKETIPKKTTLGIIKIQGGDMLERDIIPQLCKVFSLSEEKVKDILTKASSNTLINTELKDFRRMEGMILPGEYTIYEDNTLEEKVSAWVLESEERYKSLLSNTTTPNELKAYEQLILASIVQAECLNNNHQEEVATVFLNRLEAKGKLRSCVTVEYANGYQRHYLTTQDVSIKSAYNTYYTDGLPIGPICAVSNDSLQAAVQKKMDSKAYYFYYDYILNDIFFFDDYTKFKKQGAVSRKLFEDKSPVGKRAKINKQELYRK
jgi:UPF0755 protein